MLIDHVSGVDARVTKCYETLASNSSSAPSSVAVNIVQELEDKQRRKNNVLFFNIPESNASNSLEANINYASKLCKDTFNLDVQILKAFRLGKKVPNKYRPLPVQFENENAKSKILAKSYLLKSTESYSGIYVSADMTTSERTKHRLVNELKARRARGESNIIIRGNSIITKSRINNCSLSDENPTNSETTMESSS